MAKIYEYRGVRGLVAAEILEDSDSAYTTGTPFSVAGVAEISKEVESNSETKFYDNVGAIVLTSEGATNLTCSVSVIEPEVRAQLLGQFYDPSKGLYVEQEAAGNRYFAIGYIAKTTDGVEVFQVYNKVKAQPVSDTFQTENDSTDSNGNEIIFSAVNTQYRFKTTGKSCKSTTVHTDVNPIPEADFFATIQTPDTIQPASQTAQLTGLTIASCTLTPAFDTAVTSYATTTSNASNKVTATVSNGGTAEIKVNGSTIENGGNATWTSGSNTLTVKVGSTTYTVTVTKE